MKSVTEVEQDLHNELEQAKLDLDLRKDILIKQSFKLGHAKIYKCKHGHGSLVISSENTPVLQNCLQPSEKDFYGLSICYEPTKLKGHVYKESCKRPRVEDSYLLQDVKYQELHAVVEGVQALIDAELNGVKDRVKTRLKSEAEWAIIRRKVAKRKVPNKKEVFAVFDALFKSCRTGMEKRYLLEKAYLQYGAANNNTKTDIAKFLGLGIRTVNNWKVKYKVVL